MSWQEKEMWPEASEAVDMERARQNAKWGGAQHDDDHDGGMWCMIMQKHMGKLATKLMNFPEDGSPSDYREVFDQTVKVCAIALALCESMRRGGCD